MKIVIDVCGGVCNQIGIINENMRLYATLATALLGMVTVAAVVKTRSDKLVQTGQNDHFSQLPAEIISKIVSQLNKQDASRLTCVSRRFNTVIGTSGQIKRPLTAIGAEFKTDVRDLKAIDEIPAYMYEGVKELRGHTDWVVSITQLTDGRIVSGSVDCTLRVWDLGKRDGEEGYVRELTGHTDYVSSVTQLKDGRIVSGSQDGTLRVLGYVELETGSGAEHLVHG